MQLLTTNNAKTVKGEKYGVLTGVLYLAPNTLAGRANLCPDSTPGCRAACLFTAGRGRMDAIQQARLRKTRLLFDEPEAFHAILKADVHALQLKAKRRGLQVAVRLNGTSDLPWEESGIMQEFPNVQWYDYTKSFARMMKYLGGEMPENYHLTFSRDETNQVDAETVLHFGGSVAVVFDELPETYLGYPVVDGDLSDLRFRAPKSTVIGLSAKGEAKSCNSGFVVRVAEMDKPAMQLAVGG